MTKRGRRAHLFAGVAGLTLWTIAIRFVLAVPAETNGGQQTLDPRSTRGLIPHWTGVIDPTGHCRYSVPPAWTVERQPHGNAIASAPDGMATAQIDWSPSSSWRAQTSNLRRSLEPILIEEDSAGRFWCEYRAGWPGVHYYVAIPSAAGLCTAWIDVRAGANDWMKPTIRQIAESVVALQ